MKIRRLQTSRGIFGLIAFFGGVLLAVAFYMQHQMGLLPCNLCLFQRYLLLAVVALSAVAVLLNLQKIPGAVYALFTMLVAGAGMATSLRQLWLQNLPKDQVPACGADLEYMLEVYPFFTVIAEVFQGSGDCAKVQWQFLSLSIPAWMALCFGLIIVLLLYLIIQHIRNLKQPN